MLDRDMETTVKFFSILFTADKTYISKTTINNNILV